MKTYTAKQIKEELTKVMKPDSVLFNRIVGHFKEETIEEESTRLLRAIHHRRGANKTEFCSARLGTKHLMTNSFRDTVSLNTAMFLKQNEHVTEAHEAFSHGFIAGMGLWGEGLLGEKEL